MDVSELRLTLERDGYTEILTREFAAGVVLAEHSHAWDARLHVLRGEMQLDCGDCARTLRAGDHCEVPCGALHAERYGPDGTSLLIGRRYAPPGGTSTIETT
jgi:quercetin dioxygenase-like cupin family protein